MRAVAEALDTPGCGHGAKSTAGVQAGVVTVVVDLDIPAGGRVRTTWRPAIGTPRGWVWVQHGFSRHARHLAGVAELLSSAGLVTVAPDIATLRPWRSVHDTTWLTSVTATVARAVEGGLVGVRGIDVRGGSLPWTGVGHSAGCAVVAHAATVMAARGSTVSGLVLLDPVDTVGGVFARALPELDQVAMEALTCRPSRCNRAGVLGMRLAAAGRPVLPHPDLNHADPERIPGALDLARVPAAGRAATAVCGAAGSASAVLLLGGQLVDSVERQLASGSP